MKAGASPFHVHSAVMQTGTPSALLPGGVHHSPTLMLSRAASVANSSAFS